MASGQTSTRLIRCKTSNAQPTGTTEIICFQWKRCYTGFAVLGLIPLAFKKITSHLFRDE